MVFIQFIFNTLCTLIHKDADIQLIMLHSALVFQGNMHHALSRTELRERENVFSRSS